MTAISADKRGCFSVTYQLESAQAFCNSGCVPDDDILCCRGICYKMCVLVVLDMCAQTLSRTSLQFAVRLRIRNSELHMQSVLAAPEEGWLLARDRTAWGVYNHTCKLVPCLLRRIECSLFDSVLTTKLDVGAN
jgi:hypothetical protein